MLSPDNVLVGAVGHFGLAAFYLYVAYGLVSYVFSDSWVTSDELFAVGAAFTVLLFAFAYLYLGVQFIWPDSFTGHVPGPRRRSTVLWWSVAPDAAWTAPTAGPDSSRRRSRSGAR